MDGLFCWISSCFCLVLGKLPVVWSGTAIPTRGSAQPPVFRAPSLVRCHVVATSSFQREIPHPYIDRVDVLAFVEPSVDTKILRTPFDWICGASRQGIGNATGEGIPHETNQAFAAFRVVVAVALADPAFSIEAAAFSVVREGSLFDGWKGSGLLYGWRSWRWNFLDRWGWNFLDRWRCRLLHDGRKRKFFFRFCSAK